MMSMDRLLAFVVTATVIIVVPGPGVLFGVGRALAYGRKTALASVVGGETAVFVMSALVALGMGAFVARSSESRAAQLQKIVTALEAGS